jgi:hypothetical protein
VSEFLPERYKAAASIAARPVNRQCSSGGLKLAGVHCPLAGIFFPFQHADLMRLLELGADQQALEPLMQRDSGAVKVILQQLLVA